MILEVTILLFGIVFLLGMTWLMRRRRGRFGPAAVGMLEPFMLQAQRQATEVIVEGKAEARDPEHKEGNLPDLAGPGSGGARAGSFPGRDETTPE
jgi:hypothetical protein